MPTGTTTTTASRIPLRFSYSHPAFRLSLFILNPFDRTFRNYASLIKEFAGEGSPTRGGDGRGGGDDAPLQVRREFFFLFLIFI